MFYCFLTMDSAISNVDKATNVIGELSEKGFTYARDVKKYSGHISTLNVFGWSAITSQQTLLLNAACAELAVIMDGVVNYENTAGNLLADIKASLGGADIVSNVSLGVSILNPKDGKHYPAFVQFTITLQQVRWEFKVWLANSAFLTNYPLGQIELVYPISNLLTLSTNYAACEATVRELGPTDLVTKASVQVKSVVTGYDGFSIQVYDRSDLSRSFLFPIFVAYNGGSLFCNQKAYLAAFKTALLASSTLTLEDWLVIIPRLEPLIKYYIIPTWENTSIISGALPAPICSPTIGMNLPTESIASDFFPNYTNAQVSDYLNYSVAMYKSIGFYALPDKDNLDGRLTWREKFADYFLISLTDMNVALMSATTQEVTALLDTLLKLAEAYVLNKALPIGVAKETRGNAIYLSKSTGSMLLSVMTRVSALAN